MSLSPEALERTVAALAAPLEPAVYRQVERAYVARSIAELLHEKLLTADASPLPTGRFRLRISGDESRVQWTCQASPRRLDFWHVFPETVERWEDGVRQGGEEVPRLFTDLRRTIGIEPFTLARFLEESAQTLYADAFIRQRGRPTAHALARADHAAIERAMEGHPWILVNKGRMGFGAVEQQAFTPEAGQPQRLVWLAARRDAARCDTVEGLSYDALLERELGPELEVLRARLVARGLKPADYLLLPAHPWQYAHKLVVQYAAEIAEGRLVPLGASATLYRAQQSIRTFQAVGHPERCYVKTALSILNTGQIRGLSPEKLRRAPVVTEWLRARFAGDPVLRASGWILLGEIATVGYTPPAASAVPGIPYQYRELLGVLYRESATPSLQPGETLATMASLLYVDDEGKALVAALAARAGVGLSTWLQRYLDAYLVPLLHCFFHHETFFIAHGENVILVLRDGLPTRVVLKDLVEEVQVSKRVRATLPEELRALLYDIDDPLVPLFLLTDVLDGFFRYLADVLVTHCGYAEDDFWRQVARTVRTYQDAHPEHAEAYARWDLFTREFPRFCLNKYRLVLFGYADTSENVVDTAPKFTGTLSNPLAEVKV